MEWKLYYDDQTTFSDEDGSWQDAPAWGVVAIVTADSYVGRIIDSPRRDPEYCDDYYIWPQGKQTPACADFGGLVDMLVREGHMTGVQLVADFTLDELTGWGVKFGRAVDNDRWRELAAWVLADADATFDPGVPTDERPPVPPISG